MILETAPQIPLGRDRRLVALLDEREQEVKAFSDAMNALKDAHKEAITRIDGRIYSLRLEITTGQTSLMDAMTEISHERPNGQS